MDVDAGGGDHGEDGDGLHQQAYAHAEVVAIVEGAEQGEHGGAAEKDLAEVAEPAIPEGAGQYAGIDGQAADKGNVADVMFALVGAVDQAERLGEPSQDGDGYGRRKGGDHAGDQHPCVPHRISSYCPR